MNRLKNRMILSFIIMIVLLANIIIFGNITTVSAKGNYVSENLRIANECYESGDYKQAIQICNEILDSNYYLSDATYKKANKIIEKAESNLKTLETKEAVQGEWFVLNGCSDNKRESPVNYIEFNENGTCNIRSGKDKYSENKYSGTYNVEGACITCIWKQKETLHLNLEYSETGILYGLCMDKWGECCAYIKAIDVSKQIETANKLFNEKKYLETINICDNALSMQISQGDRAALTTIKNEAVNNYNNIYIDEFKNLYKQERYQEAHEIFGKIIKGNSQLFDYDAWKYQIDLKIDVLKYMSTSEFDAGMKKGIDYYNRGMYYEARDEFQWFCDANWRKMNAVQQKYALDYLDGTKQKIWELKYDTPEKKENYWKMQEGIYNALKGYKELKEIQNRLSR